MAKFVRLYVCSKTYVRACRRRWAWMVVCVCMCSSCHTKVVFYWFWALEIWVNVYFDWYWFLPFHQVPFAYDLHSTLTYAVHCNIHLVYTHSPCYYCHAMITIHNKNAPITFRPYISSFAISFVCYKQTHTHSMSREYVSLISYNRNVANFLCVCS